MTIEQIKYPEEIVLYSGTSNVNNKVINSIIFIVLLVIDILSFFAFNMIADIENAYRIAGYSFFFIFGVVCLTQFISSLYLIVNNSSTKYWITNQRIIALKGDKVIDNEISELSVVNFLNMNKDNIGSIMFVFGVDENFITSFRASFSTIKDTNKVILFNRVQDPIKAIKIVNNLNEDIYISDDKKILPQDTDMD